MFLLFSRKVGHESIRESGVVEKSPTVAFEIAVRFCESLLRNTSIFELKMDICSFLIQAPLGAAGLAMTQKRPYCHCEEQSDEAISSSSAAPQS